MSRINNNSRSINTASQITPCCKVCKDAGKPESEYTSHWVKDKEGKVICPYIKGLNCNYCMNYGNASQAAGHTPKYCKFLKKNTICPKSCGSAKYRLKIINGYLKSLTISILTVVFSFSSAMHTPSVFLKLPISLLKFYYNFYKING